MPDWLGSCGLVEDGDIIFVNSGTTPTQVIRHIPVRADVTVITNNIGAAFEVDETGLEGNHIPFFSGKPRKSLVRFFFATDIHGSDPGRYM